LSILLVLSILYLSVSWFLYFFISLFICLLDCLLCQFYEFTNLSCAWLSHMINAKITRTTKQWNTLDAEMYSQTNNDHQFLSKKVRAVLILKQAPGHLKQSRQQASECGWPREKI
jgi:hypothetical protein